MSDPISCIEPLNRAWPERELSQLAALRQPTPLRRFSARANFRAAAWDQPRSDRTAGVSRFMERFPRTNSRIEPLNRLESDVANLPRRGNRFSLSWGRWPG
jgi:hypothetical protein